MYKPKFSINDLIEATGGELINSTDTEFFSISTDTRTISPEDAYLALCGNIFDGHDFLENAILQGTKLAIIDEAHRNLTKKFQSAFLIVKNTTEAYLKIAKFHKEKQKARIIAVTGSSGKTTTKELLYCVFNSKFKTKKSIKNHNNEIGLCQTLLSIEQEDEYCIIEMGMRALGEIDLLAKYATPDIAIITNSGSAHIGILGSLENIAKAKSEIANYLDKQGLLIAHNNELLKNQLADGDYEKIFYDLKDVKISELAENKSKFTYKNTEFILPDGAEFNILNSLAVINAAVQEGFSTQEIQEGLLNFKNIEFRNEISYSKSGTTIISDCYNANPDSVKASLEHIAKTYNNKKIIVVFGDMLELGEFEKDYHEQIGELVNELNVNFFVSVGKLAKISAEKVINKQKKICTDIKEAAEFLQNIMDENSLIFLKASRGMQFEKILEIIREK